MRRRVVVEKKPPIYTKAQREFDKALSNVHLEFLTVPPQEIARRVKVGGFGTAQRMYSQLAKQRSETEAKLVHSPIRPDASRRRRGI